MRAKRAGVDGRTTVRSTIRRIAPVAVAVTVLVLLGACAAGPNAAATGGGDLAGFWLGLWHGLISPVTFIVSLFNDNVNIYEVRNNGNWYDFGFMLGVSTVFSGGARGSAAARTTSKRPQRPTPQDAA